MGNRLGESLRVRMRREVSDGVIMVVVHCRSTSHGKGVDGASFKQLMEVAAPQTLVLEGDFKLDDICWKTNSQTCFWRVSGITWYKERTFSL